MLSFYPKRYKHLSNNDIKNINQAIKLESGAEAKRKGWKFLGSGVCAHAWKKGNIVTKFLITKNTDKYGRQAFLRTENYLKNLPPKYKKYIAPTYFVSEYKIVQRYVGKIPFPITEKQVGKIYDLADKLNVIDVSIEINETFHPTDFWNVGYWNTRWVFYDFSHEDPISRS